MTQIDRITINDDLGTEADGDYIALVYLTWNQKNTGKTSKKMLEMYSSDLAATLGEQNSSVNEIAIFWTVPYLNDTAKCSYKRNGGSLSKWIWHGAKRFNNQHVIMHVSLHQVR